MEVQQILGEVVSGVVVEPEVVQKACVEEDRVLPLDPEGGEPIWAAQELAAVNHMVAKLTN